VLLILKIEFDVVLVEFVVVVVLAVVEILMT